MPDKIKRGLKLWTCNHDQYDAAVSLVRTGQVEFVELLYVPGHTTGLEKLSGIEVVLHGPTAQQGYCFGDGRTEQNSAVLFEMINWCDRLRATCMILHPEFGTVSNFIRLLNTMDDHRFVVENMPMYGIDPGKPLIAFTADEIDEILNQTHAGFCLDLAHAVKAALALKTDYKPYVRRFMAFHPVIAHISDGRLDNTVDEHLDLGQGEFDLEFLNTLISKSSVTHLTFEVPKKNGLENDIKNMGFMHWG